MESGEVIIFGILGAVLIFIIAMICAVFGAFAGWVVGFTPLGTYILNFLSAASIKTNMVDFGACMGFVGGLFSGSSSSRKD